MYIIDFNMLRTPLLFKRYHPEMFSGRQGLLADPENNKETQAIHY